MITSFVVEVVELDEVDEDEAGAGVGAAVGEDVVLYPGP
jgi:hypothetical protein